jgi:glycosyltransferase involved in cell wall biosynthesis
VAALGADAVVIPPGIELERFAVQPRPADRRVLYLGGADPGKGYEAARNLADTLRGPGLEVADPSEIPALLAAHDVLLVPSRAEAFGIAAAEAIAAGRWVVAADVGGLREVVTDGVNGTLVGDGDYARALAHIPDYDPTAVAATAARFDVAEQRRAMAAAWDGLLERR